MLKIYDGESGEKGMWTRQGGEAYFWILKKKHKYKKHNKKK